MSKTEKKQKRKEVECIECGRKTDNYYSFSINSGRINRCSECHELYILRSTRYDFRISEQEEK